MQDLLLIAPSTTPTGMSMPTSFMPQILHPPFGFHEPDFGPLWTICQSLRGNQKPFSLHDSSLVQPNIRLQFGVRAENLERLLEAYLGPDGVVDKEGLDGLLEKTSDSIGKFGEYVWNRVTSATRSKRANIKPTSSPTWTR